MQPALQALTEAKLLSDDGHPSAAVVFYASAVELFLKATILQPLVFGLVHNDRMAVILVNYAVGQAGFERYIKLLANLFQEIADLDLKTIRRDGSAKPLMEECTSLSAQRNDILHKGITLSQAEALTARGTSGAVYTLLVRPMLTALGLYILKEGMISTSPYRTVKRSDGIRVLTHDILIGKGGTVEEEDDQMLDGPF
jgi:hypothetical protein